LAVQVMTGKPREVSTLLEAFSEGRSDPEFFCHFFLGRHLHEGQARFMRGSQAKVNALATANRWGKTTLLTGEHAHAGTYKTGAEFRYTDEEGRLNLDAFTALKYETVHTAGEWEQASFVWEDALKLILENPRFSALVAAQPRSKPPYIKGINGWKWMFRTLGSNASNIDGKSIYLLSIDEAGWVDNLDEMMRNVLRVRTADVRGRIIIVGTFKPGISRDFYKICVRASAYTGSAISFAHQTNDDGEKLAAGASTLNAAITAYLAEYGIDLTEYRDALQRGLDSR
jgi:hypothetical protein